MPKNTTHIFFSSYVIMNERKRGRGTHTTSIFFYKKSLLMFEGVVVAFAEALMILPLDDDSPFFPRALWDREESESSSLLFSAAAPAFIPLVLKLLLLRLLRPLLLRFLLIFTSSTSPDMVTKMEGRGCSNIFYCCGSVWSPFLK